MADDWQIVRAGPKSRLGLRLPARRRAISIECINPKRSRRTEDERSIEIIVEIELRRVDGVCVGPYELRSISIKDRDGLGLTPELLRSLPMAQYIRQAGESSDRIVEIDPTTGVATDHLHPRETLRGDDLVVAYWLRTMVINEDTNKAIAELLEITPTAAGQRIHRLRKAGLLPPAETRGRQR